MIRKVFERLQVDGFIYPLKSRDEIIPENSVDQLFAVFSEYVVCMPPCDTCFPDVVGLYRRLASITDIRKADLSDVACLYWEGAYCGGSSNWKRFFPVMLLSGLWDHGGCDLFDRAVGEGMWAWPEVEQTAIRDVVVSAFLDWTTDCEVAPLGYDSMLANPQSHTYNKSYVKEYEIGIVLITAVFLCRVNPISVFSFLLEQDSSKARMLLTSVISGHLEFWGWGVISDDEQDLGQYAIACEHLAQQMVSEERLIQWYIEAGSHEETQRCFSAVVDNYYFGDLPTNSPRTEVIYDIFKEAYEKSSARIV